MARDRAPSGSQGQPPPGSQGLMPGPCSTLVLSGADGSLRLLRLSRREAGWQESLDYHLLYADQFESLGFPGRWHTFAVAGDGSIILGFDHSVARLPPGAAMLVAVDGHGRVWVVDAAARTAFRIVPGSPKVKALAKSESWPSGFTPYDTCVFGGPTRGR